MERLPRPSTDRTPELESPVSGALQRQRLAASAQADVVEGIATA